MKVLKRKPRSYKIADVYYKRATKRAKKDKIKLSTILERVVAAYGNGMDVKAVKINDNHTATAFDIFTEDATINFCKP